MNLHALDMRRGERMGAWGRVAFFDLIGKAGLPGAGKQNLSGTWEGGGAPWGDMSSNTP